LRLRGKSRCESAGLAVVPDRPLLVLSAYLYRVGSSLGNEVQVRVPVRLIPLEVANLRLPGHIEVKGIDFKPRRGLVSSLPVSGVAGLRQRCAVRGDSQLIGYHISVIHIQEVRSHPAISPVGLPNEGVEPLLIELKEAECPLHVGVIGDEVGGLHTYEAARVFPLRNSPLVVDVSDRRVVISLLHVRLSVRHSQLNRLEVERQRPVDSQLLPRISNPGEVSVLPLQGTRRHLSVVVLDRILLQSSTVPEQGSAVVRVPVIGRNEEPMLVPVQRAAHRQNRVLIAIRVGVSEAIRDLVALVLGHGTQL